MSDEIPFEEILRRWVGIHVQRKGLTEVVRISRGLPDHYQHDEIRSVKLDFDPGSPDYSSWTPGDPMEFSLIIELADGETIRHELEPQDVGGFIEQIAKIAIKTVLP